MNYAIVPARGGSKSIPLKNIKEINGRPLIWWVLNAANKSNLDRTFVATDSDEIRGVVEAFGFDRVEVVGRSPESAGDVSPTEHVMYEFAKDREFGGYMLIQATSPLLTERHINDILDLYAEGDFDTIVPVVAHRFFVWKKIGGKWVPMNFDPKSRPMRQQMEAGDRYITHVDCGAAYMMGRAGFLEHRCRLYGNIGAYVFPEQMGIEIDEPWQWSVVEALLKKEYG